MTATPDFVVSTGDFIAEWMEDAGVNGAELARRLGVSSKHVSELLAGKATLSAELAIALERVTGVPARLWNAYEAGYRDDLARRKTPGQIDAAYREAKQFPLAYLRKFGFITAPARDKARTVEQLLALLGVASFDAWRTTWTLGSVAYRRAAVGHDNAPALAVWLTLGERHVREHEVPEFDSERLRALIPVLRAATAGDPLEAVEQAVADLHEAGVVLCFVPAVPGLGIHGATRWINRRPVIQLSLLWKCDDQLWFTLFHELGHVLLHGDKALYLNGEKNHAEDEADAYASQVLIPDDDAKRLPPGRDVQAVRAFAAELGIAPSIVLGRVQHTTKDYAWGHELRHRLDFKPHTTREAHERETEQG